MADKKFSSEKMERYFNDPEYRHGNMKLNKRYFKKRYLLFFAGIFVAVALLTWYSVYIVNGLPTLEQLENPKPELATKIYSADGEVLDQFAFKNRTRVTLNKLPAGLTKALVATEDKDFYNHWGVNLPRFIRQMIINVVTFRQAGASTITQQLARNLYGLQIRHETMFDKITRKIREFFTSVQIERRYTKNEIMEFYLNISGFGRGAYGIESAAQMYFGKSAADLTTPEYTLLIGMLKGPSYYDPFTHADRAFERRSVVINQMVKEGLLTEETAKQVRADSLELRSADSEFRSGIAPHFVESIRQQLLKNAEMHGYNIYRDGLRIYTSLDSRMQRYAISAIEEHLKEYQQTFDATWDWKEHPDIMSDVINKAIREDESYSKSRNAMMRDSIRRELRTSRPFIDSVLKAAQTIEVGFVVIDPHNGQIKAMIGGRNYRTFKYGLNHVTQIHRQPGSAFKPFVYTVALDNGYPACYEVLNQPVTIPMPDGSRWAPENFEKDIGGKYTLREGLKHSVNLIAVRIILEIAPAAQVSTYAHRMGITSPIPAYESLALGTAEVSPLELTSAYGVYDNEGVLVSPISILRIEDNDGNVIEENSPDKKEVLSKETAYLMTDLLKGVVNSGTGTRVRSYFTGACAGKTGTTNDFADAWFVGYTPQLVAGVWVGFDDARLRFKSADGQGGRAAAPIFGLFMQKTYEDPEIGLTQEIFVQPEGIITDTICVDTKKKAREWCPNKTTEIFNAKYPLGLCDKHTSADWNQGKESDDTRKKSKINW
ncbi:MAG: PBP1A family penicillin-binding protein [Ignavibacteriae bacterium]|nr:MAG: PBP1A family penicillin-binding protein [Ignavibacteriota bacterium]